MDDNRCNVALIRAKSCLIVVGHSELLRGDLKSKKKAGILAHFTFLNVTKRLYEVSASDVNGTSTNSSDDAAVDNVVNVKGGADDGKLIMKLWIRG